jgi:hypothetical protein
LLLCKHQFDGQGCCNGHLPLQVAEGRKLLETSCTSLLLVGRIAMLLASQLWKGWCSRCSSDVFGNCSRKGQVVHHRLLLVHLLVNRAICHSVANDHVIATFLALSMTRFLANACLNI